MLEYSTYISTAFSDVENLLCICVHVFFLIYLIYTLRRESACIPLIFSSQIPFVMFPFFRFSWSLHSLNLSLFIFFNISFICFFILKSIKDDLKEGDFFLYFFILTLLFSLIGNAYSEVSFFSAGYAISWFVSFFLAFNLLGRDKRLMFLSFYNFLLASFVMIGTGIISYIYKYGFPVSFNQIYINKLKFTHDVLYTLHIFGNIHNISPFLFFVNILSFSLILYFFNNKDALHEISHLIQTKLLSIYQLLWLNFIASFSLLFLFIARGALLLAFIGYAFSIYCFMKKETKRKKFYIFLIFLPIFPLFSKNIKMYFFNIFKSFKEICLMFFNNSTTPESLTDASVYERLDALKAGLQIIRDNLLFGIGFENYSYIEVTYTSPHNFIVQHVAETGILGALFIFSLLFYIIKQLVFQKNGFLFCLMFSLASFILYMTLFGGQLFHTGMLINGLTLLYMLFLYSRLSNRKSFQIDAEEPPISEKLLNYQAS